MCVQDGDINYAEFEAMMKKGNPDEGGGSSMRDLFNAPEVVPVIPPKEKTPM